MPPMGHGVPTKARVDDLGCQADHLEDLCAAVAGDVRDAHLRHDLQDAILDRVPEPLLGLRGRGAVTADLVGRGQLREGLEGERGADRLGAVAEQASEVVHLPSLVGLDDDRRLGAKAGGDEAVVDEPGGEKRRHRDPAGTCIRDEEHPGPGSNGGFSLVGEPIARRLEPLVREKAGVEAYRRDLCECVREQEEALELDAGGHLRARR